MTVHKEEYIGTFMFNLVVEWIYLKTNEHGQLTIFWMKEGHEIDLFPNKKSDTCFAT